MIEKVNPAHPDKIADRIAGAIVDLAYEMQENPKVAVEVLIGHGTCHIMIESSCDFKKSDIREIVYRIAGGCLLYVGMHKQDELLANNQSDGFKCGDNGIFKGMPLTAEQTDLSNVARLIYDEFKCDGKYILDNRSERLIVCQSNATNEEIERIVGVGAIINPLGYWKGGIGVDTGATNRKLGSDMANSVTGGGLHGKDLSKADVSVNIYAFLKAQRLGRPVELCCAIGDDTIDGKPYSEIVEIARDYIQSVGGFEKFAEWGLY